MSIDIEAIEEAIKEGHFETIEMIATERDALKAEVARLERVRDRDLFAWQDASGELRVDNERLRAAVQSWVDRDVANQVQLTELREAAQAAIDSWDEFEMSSFTVDRDKMRALEAVLEKVKL